MNSSSHNFSLLVTVVTILVLSCVKPSYGGSKYAVPFSKWRVTILNNQSPGTVLFVHCKSKNDDLNEHVVEVGGEYSWSFKENLWHSTLYWCAFANNKGFHARFEVYWPEKFPWLSARCDYSNCIWAATDQGFSLKNIPQNTFEPLHRWEPNA